MSSTRPTLRPPTRSKARPQDQRLMSPRAVLAAAARPQAYTYTHTAAVPGLEQNCGFKAQAERITIACRHRLPSQPFPVPTALPLFGRCSPSPPARRLLKHGPAAAEPAGRRAHWGVVRPSLSFLATSLCSFFLYSRMSPFQTSTRLFSQSHTSFAT